MLLKTLEQEHEKFREEGREEVNAMLLKTLEQEHEKFREEGREEGHEEGIKTGELIGSILTLQRILRRPVSEEAELRRQEPQTLHQMLQELETALNDSAFMS